MFTIVDRIKRHCLNPDIIPKPNCSNRAYDFKELLNLTGSLEDILNLVEFITTRLQDIDIKDLYMYSLRVGEYQYSITYLFPVNAKELINKTGKHEIYLLVIFGLGYKEIDRNMAGNIYPITEYDWELKTIIIKTKLTQKQRIWLEARKHLFVP